MKKKACFTIIAWTITVLTLLPPAGAAEVKKADLAGSWYPSSSRALSSALDGYLAQAEVESVRGKIRAIIVPHAGLAYSGPVAAYAYKAVSGKPYSAVLLLGFCHRKNFDGISVYKEGGFETPLGTLEVDSDLAADIISRHERIFFYPAAFEDENSIELELPFIKKAFPRSKIVPIAFGSSGFDDCELVAGAIADILGKRDDVLLIVSTDMSHYHTYEEARAIDSKSIELLRAFDAEAIYERSAFGEQLFCGYMPVAASLLAAKEIGADEMSVLRYANSGDVTGDKNRVVGYVSAVIYATGGGIRQEGGAMLNESQRKRLLEIARDTITGYVKTRAIPDLKEDDPVLNREMGAFVTLHKDGQLRGCIGNIIGSGPLYLTVRDMAVQSATADPRFAPVSSDELGSIDIEISVLSELEKVADAREIEMGVHGVLIRKGSASGVFLPQVATETGWSKEEFMTNLCARKAGLLSDAWKTGEADIYIFTAEVFGE